MVEISMVLYDSPLQSVSEFSESFMQEKAILNDATRESCPPKHLILDFARHYPAIRRLPVEIQRKIGRPDIAHISLLNLLHHPLMAANPVLAYVQTIGGKWFRVPPDWRIPVNYIRFTGLMRQLFSSGRIPKSGKTILELHEGSLSNLIESEGLQAKKILLSSSGTLIPIKDLVTQVTKFGAILIVGGFQKGNPSKTVLDIADEVYSIYPRQLSSWTTISLLMTSLLAHIQRD